MKQSEEQTKQKEEAITVCLFLYNEIYTSGTISKPVSKLLKQIGSFKRKLSDKDYYKYRNIIHTARNKAIDENTKKGVSFIASREDIIQTFYDALNRNPYQHIIFTEKTVVAAINSLNEKPKCKDEQQDLKHTNNSRLMINSFLENIGIKKDTRLRTRRIIQEQNLIIEKG